MLLCTIQLWLSVELTINT